MNFALLQKLDELLTVVNLYTENEKKHLLRKFLKCAVFPIGSLSLLLATLSDLVSPRNHSLHNNRISTMYCSSLVCHFVGLHINNKHRS